MALDDLQQHLVTSLRGIPQRGEHLGADDPLVSLTYWGDLQCEHCRDFTNHHLIELIKEEVRGGIVAVRFRPLQTATRDDAEFAAQHAAALAAGRQDLLWQFVEGFFLSQQEADSGYITDRYLRALADEIPDLDLDRWEAERREDVSAHLADAAADARSAGISSSPGLLLEADGVRVGPVRPDVNDVLDAVDALLN